MKANETKLLFSKAGNWIFLVAAILMFTLQQCKCKRKHSLIEIRGPVTAIHGIAFFDVNEAVLQNVRKVKVTLIDPGKMVLSSNGIPFDSVELTSGVMSIGLSPSAQFNVERPYRFTIRAEADGYMTNIRSIVITSAASNYIPIFLAKLDNKGLPSSGLGASTGNLNTVTGGVFTKNEVLTANFPNGKADSFTIRIREGTRLYNGDNPVETKGSLTYRLLFGAARDSNANRVFPGGFEVTDATDETGKKIASAANPVFFTTAGWFSMEMNIGKTVVNRFSNPIDVEIPISDSVINLSTHNVIKQGDKIPIWSLDNNTGAWHLESDVEIIASAGGGFKAKFKINHLSSFNLDFKGVRCMNPIVVTFNSVDFSSSYFSEYIRTSDNAVIKSGIVDYTVLPAGNLSIFNTPNDGTFGRLFVHEGSDATSGGRGISTLLNCGSGGTLSLLNTTPGSSCSTIQILKENTSPICPNNVWLESISPSGAYLINAGVTTTGSVNIPATSGVQTIKLYYAQSMAPSILLSITLDLDSPPVVGHEYDAALQVGLGAPMIVKFIVDGAPSDSRCGKVFKVTIPQTIIDANGLICN